MREQKKQYFKFKNEQLYNGICQKQNCECGGEYQIKHKTDHFKTKQHKIWELKMYNQFFIFHF